MGREYGGDRSVCEIIETLEAALGIYNCSNLHDSSKAFDEQYDSGCNDTGSTLREELSQNQLTTVSKLEIYTRLERPSCHEGERMRKFQAKSFRHRECQAGRCMINSKRQDAQGTPTRVVFPAPCTPLSPKKNGGGLVSPAKFC